MKVLVLGRGALAHSLSRNIARFANVYSISTERNPEIVRIADKSFVWNKLNNKAIAVWAIKEGIDIAYIAKHSFSQSGVYEELKRAGIQVIGANKKHTELLKRKKFFEISEKESIPVPNHILYDKCKSSPCFQDDQYIIREADSFIEYENEKRVEYFDNKNELLQYLENLETTKKKNIIIEEDIEGIEFSLVAFTDSINISFSMPIWTTKKFYEGGFGGVGNSLGGFSTSSSLPFALDIDSAKRYVLSFLKHFTGYRGAVTAHFVQNKELYLLDFSLGLGVTEGIITIELLRTPITKVFEKILNEDSFGIEYSPEHALLKFAVPDGYPIVQRPRKFIIDEMEIWKRKTSILFHDVIEIDNNLFTNKGRTLALFSKSSNLSEAYARIEDSFSFIKGPLWHRKDIGKKEIIKDMVRRTKRFFK